MRMIFMNNNVICLKECDFRHCNACLGKVLNAMNNVSIKSIFLNCTFSGH